MFTLDVAFEATEKMRVVGSKLIKLGKFAPEDSKEEYTHVRSLQVSGIVKVLKLKTRVTSDIA